MKEILNRMPKPRLSNSTRPLSQPNEQQISQHQNSSNSSASSSSQISQIKTNTNQQIVNNHP